MNTPMLQNPAIEDACFPYFRRGRLAAGEVTWRVCRDKRRHRITEIGRDEDNQPKAGHMVALTDRVHGKQAKRHQRITK